MDSFNDLAKSHFQFLIDDYGFALVEETEYGILYRTDLCRVSVGLERMQVSVSLRPNLAPIYDSAWLELSEVVNYGDPRMKFAPACDGDAYQRNRAAYLNKELARSAKLLRDYCDEMLCGDFSLAPKIEQYRAEITKRAMERARAQYLQRKNQVP